MIDQKGNVYGTNTTDMISKHYYYQLIMVSTKILWKRNYKHLIKRQDYEVSKTKRKTKKKKKNPRKKMLTSDSKDFKEI